MQKSSELKIYFAPLQESTDYIYRNAHSKYFDSVDKYFAPYIVRQNDGTIKKSHLRDIQAENNIGNPLIPQILAGNTNDFVFLAKVLQDNGYGEINWNLGCPYPMVTNKGLGAGLLPHPDKIKAILEESLAQINAKVSVKLRTGLTSHDDILNVAAVLKEFPLSEIILHPRFAKQLYKESPNVEIYRNVIEILGQHLIYNGDIEAINDFNRLTELFPYSTTWMIGRGILKNPFFPSSLKGHPEPDKTQKEKILRNFHDEIILGYSKLLSGDSHLLMRMEKFWSYFSFAFPDQHKTFKRIKKAANISKYEIAVNENFQRLRNDQEDERGQNP
jgi:tRNA-dihydrouridine synthase B